MFGSVVTESGAGSRVAKSVRVGAITIGNFDGVHLGHKQLINATLRHAQRAGGPAFLYTFDPHPAQFLFPEKNHQLLCSLKKSRELVRAFDLDHLVVKAFTRSFASLLPEEFIRKHILDPFQPEWVVVGPDFRFGAGRQGSIALLRDMQKKYSFQLKVIAPLKKAGRVVSSTAIKELVLKGRWDQVPALLGRYFSLRGRVVKGKGRGKKWGFPTINMECDKNVLQPARGVYKAFVLEGNKKWPAVLNMGFNPTFASEGSQWKTEVHIMGWKKPWRRKECEVELVSYIRPEKKFSHAEALCRQIKKDIEHACLTMYQ